MARIQRKRKPPKSRISRCSPAKKRRATRIETAQSLLQLQSSLTVENINEKETMAAKALLGLMSCNATHDIDNNTIDRHRAHETMSAQTNFETENPQPKEVESQVCLEKLTFCLL